jgi:hypothetical protein
MNVELSDNPWTQATLPVTHGGLGIRRATDIALPAYLSSVTGSHALISQLLPQRLHAISGTNDPKFTAAVAEWQSRAVFASVQQPLPTEMRIWDEPLVNAQVPNLLSSTPERTDKARLTAAAAPHAGAPRSSLGTRLDNSSLRIVIAP